LKSCSVLRAARRFILIVGPIRCKISWRATNVQAGSRRHVKKMGFKKQNWKNFPFYLQSSFDNGLTEHELDHVMILWRWTNINLRKSRIGNGWKLKTENGYGPHPALYTVWFKIISMNFIIFWRPQNILRCPQHYRFSNAYKLYMKVTISRKAHFMCGSQIIARIDMGTKRCDFWKCNNPNFMVITNELIVSVTGQIDHRNRICYGCESFKWHH
jgi:hypothetical protein